MANRHLFLQNRKNSQSGFNRKRYIKREEPEEQEGQPKTIKLYQVRNLRSNYDEFNTARDRRYSQRTFFFPEYIDLLEIHFFCIFNLDLKKKFFLKYGLTPVQYLNFNRTVVFETTNSDQFDQFKNDLELVVSQEGDVEYSGEDFNLIALIFKFNFIDKRSSTNGEEDILVSTIQSASHVADIQKNALRNYLQESNVEYNFNNSENLFYLKKAKKELVEVIEENFDVVKGIISARTLIVRPGSFGDFRVEYGFEVEIPHNLPKVGIIDTGVSRIQPFQDLILEDINITTETTSDHSGHGTLVAGLAVFGTELPSTIMEKYKAKCKILPIKVIHHPADSINFPKLLEAIKEAKEKQGVRIFNMSLVFDFPKDYNSSFSDFAYELDKLAYELDILIFISVGNFDDLALKELLTTDYHTEHEYPNFFYAPNSTSPVHRCTNTNICTPSESLNNISVGAVAGNLKEEDCSDITPANIYPAYYSRKFHYDYDQKVNGAQFKSNQKNKHLNKPDFVHHGGDLHTETSGIEVLASEGDFYIKRAGTSLATPLITSMAAEIQCAYPSLDVQSIKALLINTSTYYRPRQLPLFEKKEALLRKLVGFGIPQNEYLTETANNSITLVIEDQIAPLEIMSIPIHLPTYLKKSGNKLIFKISLAFKFLPDKGNHLGYLPLHMSFNLVKNIPIGEVASKNSEEVVAKRGFSWSEDHFGKENIIFSNAQSKEYRLQPNDLNKLDGEIAVAVRSLCKDDIDEGLLDFLKKNSHPFSLVIGITEELQNETDNNLYDEMLLINDLVAIPNLDAEGELTVEVEG